MDFSNVDKNSPLKAYLVNSTYRPTLENRFFAPIYSQKLPFANSLPCVYCYQNSEKFCLKQTLHR